MNKCITLVETMYSVLGLILLVLKAKYVKLKFACQVINVWTYSEYKSQIYFHIRMEAKVKLQLIKVWVFFFLILVNCYMLYLILVNFFKFPKGFCWMPQASSWYSAGKRYSCLDDPKLALFVPEKVLEISQIITKFIIYQRSWFL